jgi:hypothetical protein
VGRPKYIVTDRGWSQLLAASKALKMAPFIKVGMLEKTAARASGDLTNPELAIILHFGDRDIPGRPFLSMALHANGKDWNKHLVEIATAVLNGKISPVEGLSALGPKIVADVRRAMKNVGVPDAPSTLEDKTGSTPLIDSGELLKSVTFEVAGAH